MHHLPHHLNICISSIGLYVLVKTNQTISIPCHYHHVEAIKKISEYVAQLRRVGKGHGVWHFDQMLLEEGGAA
ncbi:unnamed protein product, partial [Vitis vinifera]|uniref:Uncharacterized protein n=1 Tax=Vitis vinifera TaxID=29760 RepID=D7SQT9_VITVI